MYEVYTLDEVMKEIKDQKTRSYIENLPYQVQVQSAAGIDRKDQMTVDNFAKDTGDFTGLSAVDL